VLSFELSEFSLICNLKSAITRGQKMLLTTETMQLHVRFNGRSEDLDLGALGLPRDADDATLRAALARRYDCAAGDLAEYVIVREAQAIIVRPVAYYG
jgi:hypothetical protein